MIDLGPGERVELGTFVLTPPLRAQSVTGLVVWPDGSSASDIEVSLTALRGGRARNNVNAKSDAQGRFTLPAFLGEEYRLTAFLNSLRDRRQWTAKVPDCLLTAQTADHKLTLQPVRPR